jgi:hypothetical protein
MRVAFTSIFFNAKAGTDDAWGLEFYYFKKLFENIGYEVNFVGNKTRTYKDLDHYVHYENVNLNDYDLVLFFPSNPIFFGGVMNPMMPAMVKLMAEYNGPVIQMQSDPKVLIGNPAEPLQKRFNLCGEHVEKWNEINKRSHYLFPGKDISKYTGWTPENVYQYDWFKYILRDRMIDLKPRNLIQRKSIKKYDVVYYGNSNRGSFREKQLRHYFPADTNNLLIGYKSTHIVADQIPKVPHSQLLSKIEECKVSLVVGDKEHLDNVITFRLYETLASDCLAAIQIEYDPNKEIIQDEVLRELLYVTNSEDVKKLVNSYSEDLLDLQKKELNRLLKDKKTQLQEFKSVIDSMKIK